MADNEAKLDWMYKGASGLVDREEYLLGRTVDKTLDQLNNEEKEKKLGIVPPKNHVEHECIPPSIRDFNKIVAAEQVDLSAKLQEDPLVAIKKQEEEARRQFLQNPVQLKKLQEALKAQEKEKRIKKKKKRKHDSSDSDLDQKLMDKFKYLKNNSSVLHTLKKQKKKSKDSILDTILMHKFNELKDKLTEEDMKDILEGRLSDSSTDNEKKINNKYRRRQDSTSSSSSRDRQKLKKNNRQRDSNDSGDVMRTEQVPIKADSKKSSDKKDGIKKRSGREIALNRKHGNYEIDECKNSKLRYKDDRHNFNTKRSSSRDRSNNKRETNSRTNSSDKYQSKEKMKNSQSGKFMKRKNHKSESSNSDCESESERYTKRHGIRTDSKDTKRNKYKKRSPSSSSDESAKEHTHSKKKLKGPEKIKNYQNKDRKNRKNITEGRIVDKPKRNSSCDSDDEIYVNKGKVENRRKHKKSRRKKSSDRSSTTDSSSDNCKYGRKNDKDKWRDGLKDRRGYEEKDSEENCLQKNDNNLDKLILQKLRTLRDSNTKQKMSKSASSDSDNKQREYSYYDSDSDKPVYREKAFGLLKADGTKIQLRKENTEKPSTTSTSVRKNDTFKKADKKQVGRMSEIEKEQLRQQMMKDAEVRERERSENLRKYREENKEEVLKDFDQNFAHKELLKSTKDTSVEERIKSKINNIQRSSAHMNSNFSKRS